MSHTRPLRIFFDATAIAADSKSGVGYYSLYLVRALAEAFPDDVQLVGHYYNFLGRHTPNVPLAANISYRQTRLIPAKVANLLRRIGIPIPYELLLKGRADILLFPNFLTQPSLFGTPIVATIHDLAFVTHPEFVAERNLHDLRRFVPQTIRRARLLLSVSNFAKQQLMNQYQLPAEHIVVTPVPPQQMQPLTDPAVDTCLDRMGIKKPYILFVGNFEPRKNLDKLISAYLACPASILETYSLVLAGGAGWKSESLRQRISDLQGQGADIITPGYVTDRQKAALYQRASLVALTSLYEGFGMQILEAMAFNRPLLLSDIPVFHEVGGRAVRFVDPGDQRAIRDGLVAGLDGRPVSAKEYCTILARYNWPDIAKSIHDKLRELA